MSHYALHTIATERYVALRREADASRLSRPTPAVPSAPPAGLRRLAGWAASIVRTHRAVARPASRTLPEQPIGA